MTNAEVPSTEAPPSLTSKVEAAKSGLRRDVQALMDALDGSELLLPLAEDLADTPEGEAIELDSELALVSHLLPDESGQLSSVLFTDPDLLDPIAPAFGWTTDGEALKVCTFPSRIALQMAHDAIDEREVVGLVIDPGSASELYLTRRELGSILGGRALPLVGYVVAIPPEDHERTLVAEGAEPPPAELVRALEQCLGPFPEVEEQRLLQTFNPERDLEPHLTLILRVAAGADRERLFRAVTSALEGKLPPPGYLDVLFEP